MTWNFTEIIYGPKEAHGASEMDEKSPEATTRVGARPTPLGGGPYLVGDSETPWRETDAKNSYKYRNPQKIT